MNNNIVILLSMIVASSTAFSAVTKVGNGDDGGDLENARLITSGMLIETRNQAIEKLKELDIKAVPNLGILLPELERSEIYLVDRNIHPKTSDDQGPEGDGQFVFARTFAEPHAATRFFPAALTLSQQQLIALHIHEALHRALPPSVREDEGVVSKIALAISSADASRDRVEAAVRASIPSEKVVQSQGQPMTISENMKGLNEIDLTDERTSNIGYAFHSYFSPDNNQIHRPIESLNTLSTELFPFGSHDWAYGIGLDFTYIHDTDEAFLGPMSVQLKTKFKAQRDFEVEAFVLHSMYMVGAQDLQNSPLGRDITSIGVDLRRRIHRIYFNTDLSYTLDSDADQIQTGLAQGDGEYIYHYGAVTSVGLHSGIFWKEFEFGAFIDATLADSYRVIGPNSVYDSGRYRIIGAGPELAYNYKDLRISLAARWVIDSTAGLRLDDLGDLMGQGLGQGYVTTSAVWRF